MQELWSDCLVQGGPFLFGSFCAADAMYAPVALRFVTYGIELARECRSYVDALLALPALGEWLLDSERETERIEL